jgi:hypothetical protein
MRIVNQAHVSNGCGTAQCRYFAPHSGAFGVLNRGKEPEQAAGQHNRRRHRCPPRDDDLPDHALLHPGAGPRHCSGDPRGDDMCRADGQTGEPRGADQQGADQFRRCAPGRRQMALADPLTDGGGDALSAVIRAMREADAGAGQDHAQSPEVHPVMLCWAVPRSGLSCWALSRWASACCAGNTAFRSDR